MWRNAVFNDCCHRRQVGIIDEWIPEVRGKRILDVGCGTGRISRHLAAKGASVTGADFSGKSIAIARAADSPPGIQYECRSVFEIDAPGTADHVLCIGVLAVACREERDLIQALTNLSRCLKPGGKLLLIEPIHAGFLHRVLDLRLEDFLEVMRGCGFAVEDCRQILFWPARLPLSEISWPPFLSRLGFYAGEWMLDLLGGKMGDYKAILASHGQIPRR